MAWWLQDPPPSCNRPWPSPRHQTTVSSNSKEEMVHHGPQQLLDVTCWWLLLSIACFIIPYSYLVCSTQVSDGALCNGLYMKNSREKKANKVKLRNYYTSQHFDSFIVIYYNFISTFRLANLWNILFDLTLELNLEIKVWAGKISVYWWNKMYVQNVHFCITKR